MFCEKLFASDAFVALQEVHGSLPECCQVFPYAPAKFYVFSTFADKSSGGLVTCIPRLGCAHSPFSQSCCLGMPGRVLRVEAWVGEQVVIHYNLHLEKLEAKLAKRVAKKIAEDIDFCQQSPLTCICIVSGDLNAAPPDARRWSTIDPSDVQLAAPPPASHKTIINQLGKLVEVIAGVPTLFHKPTRSCAEIDRIFISTPSWMVPRFVTEAAVVGDPVLLDASISDHAPKVVSIACRAPLPPELRPIPPWVCRLPEFRLFFDNLL